MDQISRFVVWLCSRFNQVNRSEFIVKELSDVLKAQRIFRPDPKDALGKSSTRTLPGLSRRSDPAADPTFKKRPKSRLPNIPGSLSAKIRPGAQNPVIAQAANPVRLTEPALPSRTAQQYLYVHHGKAPTQLLCKVCSATFQADNRFRKIASRPNTSPALPRPLFR